MSDESDRVRWRGIRPVDGIEGIWPARNAVRIYKSKGLIGIGTEIIYTVPGSTKLFISASHLASRYSIDGLAFSTMLVRDGSDDLIDYLNRHYYAIKGHQVSDWNHFPAYEVPAGYDICLYSGEADHVSYAFISGWLEDV